MILYRPASDREWIVNESLCRLPEIVSGMPDKTRGTIFCRRDGELVDVPYPHCHRDALAVAAALRDHGILPRDRVAIHGSTSYEWVLADLACLLVGALSVALYPTAPRPRVIAAARESGCRLVFTDRVEFVSDFVEEGFDVILLAGQDGADGTPSVGGFLDVAGQKTDPRPASRGGDPFTIVSTSGTLSEPKLFAVHSASLLYTMDRMAEIYGIGGQDRLLMYLPLSHLPQRMMLYWGLGAGMDFVLSDPAHMSTDTAKLSPTLHVAVPRSLQHLHGRAREMLRRGGGDAAQAFRSVFGASIKAIFVGSAASDPAVLADLIEAGLPVYEVYGTTELGMIGLNTPGATRVGTVGRPIPWGSVRIDPDNSEILVRTPTPFLYGRLIDGEIEPAAREDGAWRPTGDVGMLDADGFLTIRGRLRDFLTLSTGEKVFVRPIEDAVRAATSASLCVLTRIDSVHLRALLFFDPNEKEPADVGPGSVGCTSTRWSRTVDRCRTQLEELNRTLHPWERVRAFAVIERLPSIEEGTVTETTKLRRHKIEEIYARGATWHRVGEGRGGTLPRQRTGGSKGAVTEEEGERS